MLHNNLLLKHNLLSCGKMSPYTFDTAIASIPSMSSLEMASEGQQFGIGIYLWSMVSPLGCLNMGWLKPNKGSAKQGFRFWLSKKSPSQLHTQMR